LGPLDLDLPTPAAMIVAMTVVKINAITVREGSGDELARRFANRAGAVDDADGFEGFELMQPNDDRGTWLVITRWRDEDSFNAWVSSPAFAHGHRGPLGGGEAGPDAAAPPPVGTHSELWSYVVVDLPPRA
jgi:heme-degrading monooxygenase HmoA